MARRRRAVQPEPRHPPATASLFCTSLSKTPPCVHGLLAVMDASRGDTGAARARIDWLRSTAKDPARPGVAVATSLAAALMGVGDTSAAFDALERAQPRGAYLWYAVRAVVLMVH